MLDYDIQRFRDLDLNSVKVQEFENKKNPNLAKYFLKNALKEDQSNKNAIYVVYDVKTHEVIMYFGLRAGMVSDFSDDFWNVILKKQLSNSQNNIDDNLKFKIPDVIPAIELSYFCRNLGYSKEKDAKGSGALIFHSDIYPLVKNLQSELGFKILFLYAADSSKELDLVKYYQDKLGFSIADEEPIIPFQPMADAHCKFMYQPI